ncbi:MAG: sulfite exporter TauE/SafE family protein [Acidimicrobiia bacterium]|nr:sulfite exporter TauE/SafE family protein [Acidimicrobiia bacterium]
MTALELVIAAVLMGAGAIVQGTVGFGMNALIAPIVVLIDVDFVPGPLLVPALALASLLAWEHRHEVLRREVGWALCGRVPGVVLGVLAVSAWSTDAIGALLAVIVLSSVAASVFAPAVPRTLASLVAAGALSGFGGTTTAIGGPPMGVVYQREPGDRLRGTMSAFFMPGIALSIGLLLLSGEMTEADLGYGTAMVPGVVAGAVLAKFARPYLDRTWLREAVLTLSAVSALILLARVLT